MTSSPTPSLLYYSLYKGEFTDGHKCNFSALPRPFYILSYIDRGNVTYDGSSRCVPLQSGDVLFVPMGETYLSTWSGFELMKCTSLYFLFDFHNDPFSGKTFPMQKLSGDVAGKLIPLIKLLAKRGDNAPDCRAMSAFFEACDILLSSLSFEECTAEISPITPATNYIQRNFTANFTLDFLASLCHLSKSRFCHLFSEKMGVSPMTYKNQILTNYAIQSIKTHPEKTVEEISEEFNISSVYLRRLIKNFTGKTPAELKACERG